MTGGGVGDAAKARMTQRRLFSQSSRPCPKDPIPSTLVTTTTSILPINPAGLFENASDSSASGWRRAQPQDWKVSAIVDGRGGVDGGCGFCRALLPRFLGTFLDSRTVLLTVQLGTLVTGELLVSSVLDFLDALGPASHEARMDRQPNNATTNDQLRQPPCLMTRGTNWTCEGILEST